MATETKSTSSLLKELDIDDCVIADACSNHESGMRAETKSASSSFKGLDLDDYVIADAWSNHGTVIRRLEHGSRVSDSCCKFAVNVLPGPVDPRGDTIVWGCEVPVAPDSIRSSLRWDVVYKGKAVFFRATRIISVVASDARGKVAFLFAPRGTDFLINFERYVLANLAVVFPRECTVSISGWDENRSITSIMELHKFKIEIRSQRIEKEEGVIDPSIVKRECNVHWPFGPGFRCVTNCEAVIDYGTWDICITGEDIRLELKRAAWSLKSK